MCIADDCHEEMDRREFLSVTTAPSAGLAGSVQEVVGQPLRSYPRLEPVIDLS